MSSSGRIWIFAIGETANSVIDCSVVSHCFVFVQVNSFSILSNCFHYLCINMLCCKKNIVLNNVFFIFHFWNLYFFLWSPHLHAVPLYVSCKLLSLFASTILFPFECIFAQPITKRYQALNKSELFSCVVLYQQSCELELLM